MICCVSKVVESLVFKPESSQPIFSQVFLPLVQVTLAWHYCSELCERVVHAFTAPLEKTPARQ